MTSAIASDRRRKKLYGTRAPMATARPPAVATSASPTPPVMAVGWLSPAWDMMPKAPIMPVTVPSRPRSGARVMTVASQGGEGGGGDGRKQEGQGGAEGEPAHPGRPPPSPVPPRDCGAEDRRPARAPPEISTLPPLAPPRPTPPAPPPPAPRA